MRDRLTISLRLSSMAVILSGYLALAAVREYGNAILIIPISFLVLGPVGVWLDKSYSAYRVLMRAALIAYGCFIALTVLQLGLLNAVIMLVIVLQVCLMAQRKTAKEYYYVFLMAFFLLLAACVQSPEPSIALAMGLFLLGAVWAFAAIRLIEERRRAPASSAAVFRAWKTTGESERGDPFDFALVFFLSAASVFAIALAALFFVLTPRMEAGFLGRAERTIERTGLTQTVEIRGGSTIQDDPTAVMRVEFPDLPGKKYAESAALYWRCTTLPWYYASQWSRKGLREHLEPDTPPLMFHPAISVSRKFPLEDSHARWTGGQLIRQSIYVDDAPIEGLPTLDLVRDLHITGNRRDAAIMWDDANDFTVLLNTTGLRRITYEALSEVGDPPPEVLRQASADYVSVFNEREYNLLTYNELRPETREIVRRITANQPTPYDQAVAIQRWLSGPDFEYTTDVPLLPPRYAIDAFITQVRRGHCELFASAMALMARNLGIPSRVVVGFRGGEWNESDSSYLVRANMAHLWTEIYFVDCGWVAFDPSPRAAEEETAFIHRFRQALSRYALKAKMMWYQEVVGFDPALATIRLRNFSLGIIRSIKTESVPAREFAFELGWNQVGRWISALIILAAAGATWWRLRGIRKVKAVLTRDQYRARAVYIRLRKRLRKLGLNTTGKTAEELVAEAYRLAPGHAELIRGIVGEYNRSRFGLRAFPPEEAARLRRRIASIKRRQS